MRALVQRVREAAVDVEGRRVAEIGAGLLILLGVHQTDTDREADWVARKCSNLRIFPDEDGKMNRSLIEVGGEALVVSQFTLYGDTRKGNRPSFVDSAPPEIAVPLYETFVRILERELGRAVPTGEFGAMMDVSLVNDGPVTVLVERLPG